MFWQYAYYARVLPFNVAWVDLSYLESPNSLSNHSELGELLIYRTVAHNIQTETSLRLFNWSNFLERRQSTSYNFYNQLTLTNKCHFLFSFLYLHFNKKTRDVYLSTKLLPMGPWFNECSRRLAIKKFWVKFFLGLKISFFVTIW